jgi:NAD(P)-dependent dehydrogenase (short-subunit alcohol dehydrogenase family)
VRRAAAQIAALGRLHVLVNNAGAIFGERELTVDGYERTFALNHLAYFLMTVDLLEVLRRSAPARVVNVSSEAHRMGRIDFADLHLERGYSQFGAYARSKLANVLFTRELARRLQGSGVTANSLHPGTIGSGFGRSGSAFFRTLVALGRPFLARPETGARTPVYLASSPDVEGVNGEYFVRERARRPSAAALDDAAAARLWAESERLVETAERRAAGPGTGA